MLDTQRRNPPFKKLLAANRGEIAIRVFRAATELGIPTVAIYSKEDRFSLHRYKADESYLVGRGKGPVAAYLDGEEIIELALSIGVDAIHPGYGFVSERPEFATACERAGITFIGPPSSILRIAGDKREARKLAAGAGVPVMPGTEEPITDLEQALGEAERLGYPVMIKAAHGGGGRGMRACRGPREFREVFELARREAEQTFGNPAVFLEKLLVNPRHIEVQVLADHHGNVVHLFERDCSIQRRYQKIIETAPARGLDPGLRKTLCEMAVHLARAMEYRSAGTFEFLVDESGSPYFIEVNPRIQVEQTVTEVVTGIDIVQAQLWIAAGLPLDSPEIGIPDQDAVATHGFALQCRITTEDPTRGFTPDYGKITAYRSASGFGVRLDAGSAFNGAVVTPYYDSLLVKVTAWGRTFPEARRRMQRTLSEFRVRGVTTNIPFLSNVVTHPEFQSFPCHTGFIDTHPELFRFPPQRDRASKLLSFLGDIRVHGNPALPPGASAPPAIEPPLPRFDPSVPSQPGSKQILEERGPEGLARWMRERKELLVTDTTFRDAHQSLLATRMRTYDLVAVAESYARLLPGLFSMEVWGGATFDAAMRFLREDPWERLARLREAIPNILLQMLIRGNNAVGYSRYQRNVVSAFVREAAATGIDIFRIFDSLNYVPSLTAAIEAVREAGRVAEAAICYTGDILDPKRDRYTLKYYVELAKELERSGAHVLGIKDMAGLCKPYAAAALIKALREEVGLPIHFHTHDTSGIQAASILMASEAGVDAVDLAVASMSGCTSQVNLNSIVAILKDQPRDPKLSLEALNRIADYFEDVRRLYHPYESDLRSGTAEVYEHEMPGGQYSNLKQQAAALGLGNRWAEVKRAYVQANQLLGDIVKVTPSSKVVGDLALFMVSNNLTPDAILSGEHSLSFPPSVVGFFRGNIGSPPFGFPQRMREIVLKGDEEVAKEPADVDLAAVAKELAGKIERPPTPREVLSYLMYPNVFLEYAKHRAAYDDVSVVPTRSFFFGPEIDEEITIEIEKGKTVIFKLVSIGEPGPDGIRRLVFDVNGAPREVLIEDRTAAKKLVVRPKADPNDLHHLGAPMQGIVSDVLVAAGQEVREGDTLLVIESMKLCVNVTAPFRRKIKEIFVAKGETVDTGDLPLTFE